MIDPEGNVIQVRQADSGFIVLDGGQDRVISMVVERAGSKSETCR